MKALKILFTTLTLITFLSSCSDDFGLEYEITDPIDLSAAPGEDLEITINFESEAGVQQAILESELLMLDYLENFASPTEIVTTAVVVTIPTDAEEGDIYDVRVEFSDINGNSMVDSFSIVSE